MPCTGLTWVNQWRACCLVKCMTQDLLPDVALTTAPPATQLGAVLLPCKLPGRWACNFPEQRLC